MSLRGHFAISAWCGVALFLGGCASGRVSPVAVRPQPVPEVVVQAPPPQAPPTTEQEALRKPTEDVPVGTRQAQAVPQESAEPTFLEQILATNEESPEASDDESVPAPRETVYDIDIQMNERVSRFVDLFGGRLKGYLEEGLGRGAQYLPMIQEVFRAEGLPLDLAYVPLVESAFKPAALSRARAKGIWQFMQGTALENGLRHDWYIDERSEPEKATRAAAKYLKTLHGMFGDWHLALAAYNGGPGRVQRALRRSRMDDFWSLSASARYLPRETRDYVPLILAAIVVARNPDQYGVSITPVEPVAVETVRVAGAVDIRRIAEWADTPLETIQTLNPELRRWTTPAGSEEYAIKVPAGTADIVLQRMTMAEPEELSPLNWYSVKKGQTLLGIARALGVTRADLAAANYLSVRAKLQTGQRLVIPRAPSLLASGTAAQSGGVVAAAAGTSRDTVTPVSYRGGAADQERVTHVVRRGDTLYAIARLYDTTIAQLQRWNRLRGSAIKVGQRLTILGSGTAATN